MKLTMHGNLAECVLIACATDAQRVRHLVPPGLELLVHEGTAFWNIVCCRVEGIRPAGAPSALGINYSHLAYRLYVRAILENGDEQRGIYFLRSDVDSRLVDLGAKWLTDFQPLPARVDWEMQSGGGSVSVQSAGGNARCSFKDAESVLHPELEQILKYEPAGLSVDASGKNLKIAEVIRDESLWIERPIEVTGASWEFLEKLGEHDLSVLRATRVEPLPYCWRLGKRLRLRSLDKSASLVAR